MKQHRPHGKAPTTWEADILKVRAFEVVLTLFYMEDLRQCVIRSIQTTDAVHGVNRLDDGKPKTRDGKILELARAVLVSEDVINQAESDDLKELVDYRNIIGHKIHDLTVDVGAHSHLTPIDPATFVPIPAYDYTAAKRARDLRKKVMDGMVNKFIMSASLAPLAFEAAETVYLAEIERLKRRVNKSIDRVNGVIAEANRIIDAIPRSVLDSAQPSHPGNSKENGTLSKRGASCAFQLFDAKASPLAVAYLMRLSHRAAASWFAKWKDSKENGDIT
ncbi:hypothetical protein [Ralstonia pseudosolanacearum]|uniref:hypothetical protein n=1 Tax=Ralstonia pseudosolanacearum TaxID=1310165 RepID=UPI0040546064